MSSTTVRLAKGDSPNWGFRLQGGKDFGTPLVIQKVNGGSPAERAGLVAGDAVIRINNVDVYNLLHKEAQDVIVRAGHTFDMTIQRGGSTWRPSVVPVGPAKSTPHINDARPVTKTSLAARPGENIGAIGTGHNVAAKPFSPQVNGSVNGVPKLVNKQYNSPLKLYSEDAIAETISAQSEVLSTGALGVNFKKNEKNYDATNSAVYRMLQEAENEPRSPTGEVNQSAVNTEFYSHQSHAIGGRRTVTPRPSTPGGRSESDQIKEGESVERQATEGVTICYDCERVIVGVFVRIKDKNLHVECFKCSTCGSSLKNVGYYNINNKLYCDVHAKAAARSNPTAALGGSPFTPAPPGAPANAISQALQSHSLAAPLSPKINSLGTSYQPTQNYSSAPKSFSSVSAPLSPGGTLPRAAPLSPASTLPRSPLSPVVAAPAPTYNSYSPASSAGKNSHNIVWPPPQEKTEVPTACPLFYPPPSQVEASIIHKREQKIRHDSENYEENLEVEGINAMASNPYFSEDISYAGRRKSTSECVEILSETLQTQKFVESIVKQNVNVNIPPVIVTEAPIADLRRPTDYSPNTIECSLPQKIDNAVPQKWESPLTQVIRTTPPDKDTFSQIPSKKSSSALVSALSTAPDTPFTPIPHSSLDPVPLPEMTEPYFPPERKITVPSEEKTPPKVEQKPKSESPFLQALKVAPDRPFTPVGGSAAAATPPPKKKVKDPTKKYFEDLPKPTEKLDMRTALTTAPDRPYSPLVPEVKSVNSSEGKPANVGGIDKSILEKPLKPDVLPESFKMNKKEPKPPSYYPPSVLYEATQENYTDEVKKESQSKQTTITETQTIQPGEKKSQIYVQNEGIESEKQTAFAPIFQGFSCSFQNKTDHSQFSIEINTTPPVPTPPPKPQTPIAYIATVEERPSIITKQTVTEEKSDSQKVCSKQEKSKEEIKISTEIPKQREEVVQVKPISVTSMLKKPEALPQYQVELQQTAEADLRYMEKVKKMQSKKSEQQQQHVSFEQSALTSKEMKEDTLRQQKITKPIITLQPGDNNNNIPSKHTFQPVLEDKPQNTSFSPKPRALTPSMMSKPPPILPYYQANLVAQHQPAPMTHLLDPKSPNVSRSPSPCVDKLRSPSPFVVKAKEDRSKSPAAGPPQNPLQGSRPLPTPESSRVEVAKQNLTTFIPEYKNRRDLIEHARGMDFYKKEQPFESSQMYASQVESSSQSFPTVSSYEKYGTKSQNYEKEQEIYKAQKYDVKDDKKKQSYVSQSEQGVVQTDISQRSHQENLEALQKSQSHSVERSADGSCQIQRKKTVVEEYESSHKEQTIEIAKNVTSTKQYPFSKSINNPEIDITSSKGHSTNPHPISCKKQKDQPQIECCNKKPCQPLQECPCPTCPMASQPVTKPVFAPPNPVQHVSAPGPSKNTNVVPQTDTGLGGGRQSGGISVTPRRGRGVLNAASVGGSRVPLCGSCHSQIRGPFITALGKIWCPQHFVCATPSCRRPLQDIGFVEEKGQLHCEYCFEQYLAPPCSKCGSKIKGDCLKAIGKNFHPECFNCSYCGKLFGNNPFFLEDGSPYCEADWNEMFTTKCFACGFPVEAGDRWVEALNNNYHSQCFNCTMCKKNLEGQSFFAKGGRPFCKNHAR